MLKVKPTKSRKARVSFSLKKDILLLRAALQFNPWQLGYERWQEVIAVMNSHFDQVFSSKAVQKRVELLVKKYKKEELIVVTGEEEEVSERSSLLKDIISIQEEEHAAINVHLNADTNADEEVVENNADADAMDDNADANVVGDNADVDLAMNNNYVRFGDEDEDHEEAPQPTTNSAKQRRLERATADKERATYIDMAAGPNGGRSVRTRLSLEDQVMMDKHKHDLLMETKKIELENQRLKIEEQREIRLKEECERRDALITFQMEMQKSQMEMQKSQLEMHKSQLEMQTVIIELLKKSLDK